ncbi:YhcH/YjgK/YiaL family protein [Planctomycetota bacterium]
MIVDRIENAYLYEGVSGAIAKALQALKEQDLTELADGRHDIDGDNIFLLSQRYETKPFEQGKLEAHRKYIDIQFVAAGREILAYAPLENLEIDTDYVEADDYALYNLPENVTPTVLTPGIFCILFPADTHMPGCQLNGAEEVHKIVVKVKING